VVLYERAKEILDAPHYYLLGSPGKPDCFDLGFGRSAVHLYAVLVSQPLVTVYKEIAVYPLFRFTVIGFLGNCLLTFRTGEVLVAAFKANAAFARNSLSRQAAFAHE
jgi:hypothetical protein